MTHSGNDLLDVAPIAGSFGAEIGGINIHDNLHPDVVSALQDALVRYKVLVIRDQHALKPDDQLAFARRLGELEIHPFTPSLDGYPEILEFAHDGSADAREKWHTDLSFRQAPSMAAVLRAVVVPEFGRDTVFADMEAAYDGLSKPMQGFLHSLTAVHDWRNGRGY